MSKMPQIGQPVRGVSIIGVGCSVFGDILTDPRIKGLTWRELWVSAFAEALEDAHITPKAIDMFLIGNMVGSHMLKNICLHGAASYWGGMDLIPGVQFNAACATTNFGMQLGVGLVASGMQDIVMISGVEVLNSRIIGDNPLDRKPDPDLMNRVTNYASDPGYWYPSGDSSGYIGLAEVAYAKRFNIPIEMIEEADNCVCITQRENGVRNPKAYHYQGKTFKELAKENGFRNEMEYLKSNFNPYLQWPLRAMGFSTVADGASAYILAPSDRAGDYTKNSIDIIGVGASAHMPLFVDDYIYPQDVEAFRQAYEMAGIQGTDLDCLSVHDCFSLHHFTISEAAGYFAPGEGIKAVIEGRTRLDGDKPLTPSGGRLGFGHAWTASAGAEVYDAVKQMRGQAANQLSPLPELYAIHNEGLGVLSSVMVLKAK